MPTYVYSIDANELIVQIFFIEFSKRPAKIASVRSNNKKIEKEGESYVDKRLIAQRIPAYRGSKIIHPKNVKTNSSWSMC